MNARVPTDLKHEKRSQYWSRESAAYRAAWDNPSPEAALYRELEAEVLVSATSAGPGVHILDLCCGTGRNTVAVARTGAQLTGIDGAEGMLEQARVHATEHGVDNVSFVQGDSRNLPFSDNMFDGVIGTRFMYMMSPDDKQQLLSEVRRVLKPGGRVAIQFNCGLWGIKKELGNLLTGKKFRLGSRYLWPGQVNRMFKGFEVDSLSGTKLPRLELISRLTGRSLALRLNKILRWPLFRHTSAYATVIATCRK